MRSVLVVLLLVTVFTASTTGLAQTEGTVVGNPTIDVVATENRLTWGDQQRLTVAISNTGVLVRGGPERFESRTTTARTLRVEAATDRLDPALARGITIDGDPIVVGRLGRGESTAATLTVDVADSVPSGTYRFPVRVSYQYTSTVQFGSSEPLYTERTVSERRFVTVVVSEEPRLDVAAVSPPSLSPGESGTYAVAVSNTGSATATDVGLTVSADAPVTVGGRNSSQSSVFVDELAPGDTATRTIVVGTHPTARPTTYLLRVSAVYDTPAGFERTAESLRLGFSVDVSEPADFTARR